MPSGEGGYSVLVIPEGRRHLQRLPEKILHAVLAFIHGELADNPHRLGKELGDDFAGLRSARRGDYRVIYKIDDSTRTVTIYRVQHRRDVYRPA